MFMSASFYGRVFSYNTNKPLVTKFLPTEASHLLRKSLVIINSSQATLCGQVPHNQYSHNGDPIRLYDQASPTNFWRSTHLRPSHSRPSYPQPSLLHPRPNRASTLQTAIPQQGPSLPSLSWPDPPQPLRWKSAFTTELSQPKPFTTEPWYNHLFHHGMEFGQGQLI